MADRHAAGCYLEHILEGRSKQIVFNTHVLHALSFKDENAILPEELAKLPPLLQAQIKAMGARVKAWTEKEREAFKHKLAGHTDVEEADEGEERPKRGRPKKKADTAEAE